MYEQTAGYNISRHSKRPLELLLCNAIVCCIYVCLFLCECLFFLCSFLCYLKAIVYDNFVGFLQATSFPLQLFYTKNELSHHLCLR